MRTCTAMIIASMLAPVAAPAQMWPVKEGQRVRIWTAENGPIVGRVRGAALFRDSASYDLNRAVRVQTSRGMRGHAGKGALLGAAVGVVGGLVASVSGGCDESNSAVCPVGGMIIFGGLGAGVGALIGLGIRTEQWSDLARAAP